MEKLKIMINRALLYKSLFLILDIAVINISSFLAVWIRDNMYVEEIPHYYIDSIYDLVVLNTIVTVVIFALFKLYSSLWRYASLKEFINVMYACLASVIFNVFAYYLSYSEIYRSYFILYGMSLLMLVSLSRFSYRLLRIVYRSRIHGEGTRNTMIIGAGEACNIIMKELELSTKLSSRIKCVIDDDKKKHGTYIHGVRIVGGRDKIADYAEKFAINEIIIAMPSANKVQTNDIISRCQDIPNCELKILPGVYQLVTGEVNVSKLRHVQIEDLLGREVVNVTTEKIGRYVSDKVVMITGGGGSIGSELCRQIAANGVKQLIIFDIYENNAYAIQQELISTYPNLDLVVIIGSVRNGRKLNKVFSTYRPNIVFHAAAHKHVPLMETSPNEAIKNNVFGTYKTALAADMYGVDKFVLISTDKAVNPTNIMGASKRMCEMIVQMFSKHSKTEFAAVRFGNVLGSNGSVIPLFKKQIEEGGPVTVTHPDIIRYFMTIPEAVSLVIQAGASAKGGEIFVLDMGEQVKIVDLAKNLIKLSGYKLGVDMEIKFTGLRPGEKLYEELLMNEEGLQNTDNKLIFIGSPIEFDHEEFLKDLSSLYKEAYNESDKIKQIVHKIVPTYNLRHEDILIDNKRMEQLNSTFRDTSSELPDIFKTVGTENRASDNFDSMTRATS